MKGITLRMKILVFLIIFVFALSLFRMILEWSKNNNKCSHQRYKRKRKIIRRIVLP